jgi:hypothetical protein
MLFSDGLFFPKDLMFWNVILPVLFFLTFLFSLGVFAVFLVPLLVLLFSGTSSGTSSGISSLGPAKTKRTWQGVREAALWSAFCNNIRKVLLQKDLARDYSDLWETYLPYVIIFGYLTHWKNRFVEMHAPVPYWFYTPVSHGPLPKSGGEPLTPDSIRQAFEDMVSSIFDTIAFTWKTGNGAAAALGWPL